MFEPENCVGTLASYLPFIGLHEEQLVPKRGFLRHNLSTRGTHTDTRNTQTDTGTETQRHRDTDTDWHVRTPLGDCACS